MTQAEQAELVCRLNDGAVISELNFRCLQVSGVKDAIYTWLSEFITFCQAIITF